MRKSSELAVRIARQFGLRTKAEKIWFGVAFSLLVLYAEFVVYGRNFSLAGDVVAIPWPVTLFFAVLTVPACWFGVCACRRVHIRGGNALCAHASRKRLFLLAGATFLLTFLVFFAWQRAYWPGSLSNDSIAQYRQVVSGQYNNWHPALHTWLFFALPYAIHPGLEGIVLLQILSFSAAVAYLLCVLDRLGCSARLLALAWLYIVANPNTAMILLFPWKDCAVTVFSLVVFSQLLLIYATKGDWLRKWYHLAAFTLFAFLTTGVRHNSILLIVPIFVILLVFFRPVRKQVAISAGGLLLALVILQGPVMALADVAAPDHRVSETMGLPMTILSDVYRSAPQALSEEGQAFMASLLTEEEWSSYQEGSLGAIKWKGNFANGVDEAGAGGVLRYLFEATRGAPGVALRSFLCVTRLVWDIDGEAGYSIGTYISPNEFDIQYHDQNETLKSAVDCYRSVCLSGLPQYVFGSIGVTILVLMFFAVSRVGAGGIARAFLVLAPCAYNFGTMLLLCERDFRFFHFNFVILIPLLVLLASQKVGPQTIAGADNKEQPGPDRPSAAVRRKAGHHKKHKSA